MNYLLLLAIFGGALTGAMGDSVFSNPILNMPLGEEPVLVWDQADTIFKSGNKYYLVGVNNSGLFDEMPSHIVIRESSILTDFNNATIAIPFKVGEENKLESAIIQNINGSLYLYFVWLIGPFPDWRVFVMKADNPNNPMGTWSPPKELFDMETELMQIYGSVMEHNNQLYWVGKEYDFDLFDPSSNMVIYKMKSPMEITEPGMILEKDSWKCFADSDCGVYNPHVTYNNGVSYVVYTQSHGKNTSLSYISIAEGQDPMDLESWTPPPDPVFSGNGAEDVYLVETATFTESPDGTETWMVYHATYLPEVSGKFRPRIEQVRWNPVTGEPEFPVAHGYGVPQPVPSGQE